MQEFPDPSLLWESPAVSVWSLPIDVSPVALSELQSLLSADEHKRAAVYGQKKLRDAFVVRRGILRVLLGKQLRCLPRDVPIRKNPFGKPVLASGTAHFNVSSSQGIAVWSVSSRYQVGVDIERIDDTLPSAALIADTFSLTEQSTLTAMPGVAERGSTFFRGWTGKEACVKAIGSGLSAPLAQYDVLSDAARIPNSPTTLGNILLTSVQVAYPAYGDYWVSFALLQPPL